MRLRIHALGNSQTDQLKIRVDVLARLRITPDGNRSPLHGPDPGIDIQRRRQRLGRKMLSRDVRQESLGINKNPVTSDRLDDGIPAPTHASPLPGGQGDWGAGGEAPPKEQFSLPNLPTRFPEDQKTIAVDIYIYIQSLVRVD